MAIIDFNKYGLEPIKSSPDFKSYGLEIVGDISPAENLSSQANIQDENKNQYRPQIQEEFSNPTRMPGFENLSKEEKLRRIGLSQFDPANQTSTGGFVPPGSYEHPVTRMVASILPTLAAPQLRAGLPLISGPINALSRIGAGTLGNVAYESPNIKNKEDLKDITQRSGLMNTALEALTAPFRIPAGFAEIFNPLKYGARKANQIKNEATSMQAITDDMYKPVNQKYNDFPVTVTPKKYMQSAGVNRSDLYPDAKIIYDRFMNEPNFKNLHDLQSKLGKDWARISKSPATEEKAQLFKNLRGSLQDKVQNFLSKDKEALSQYNNASNFAKDNLYPYYATPTLRSIGKGKLNQKPQVLAKSIQKGIDRTVGKEERSLIPEGHPLRNHLNDLNKRLNFGHAMEFAIPAATGTALGELTHPGLGGLIGGPSALGGAALSKIASKYGAPNMTSFMQNPMVENIFRKTSPLLYLGGRGAIGATNK